MATEDDDQRYVEYLQRQLLREGTEEFIREQASYLDSRRGEVAEIFKNTATATSEPPSKWQTGVLSFERKSHLDCFYSENIFNPLLEKALAICQKAGIEPANPIRFVNSPGLEPTAAALSSNDSHMLFAGQGTFSFCNYWSKIFSEALFEAAVTTHELKKWDPMVFLGRIRKTSIIQTATKLAVWYALHDTLVGYGKLEQEKRFTSLRVLLLCAMEIFVVGHEVSHFCHYEAYPETNGLAPEQSDKDLELNCDGIGLAVCTAYGTEEDNTFASNFIGPLILLYSIHLCEKVKEIITDKPRQHSNSHPSINERINNIFKFAKAAEVHPDVLAIMKDSLDAAMVIGSQVQIIATEIASSKTDV
jgi:hypothetical protein